MTQRPGLTPTQTEIICPIMTPIIRTAAEMLRARRADPLPLLGLHKTRMRCWPGDIDLFVELNNGRTLSLFDIGRFGLAVRIGLIKVLRQRRWGLVVAGSSVRYRARIRPFQTFEMRSRALAWDARFVYIEQSMWRGELCCNHVLLRTAVTENGRIVPTAQVVEALGTSQPSPDLPDWAAAWIDADATRPWPPRM